MNSGQGSTNFYRYTRPLLMVVLLLPLVPILTTALLYGAATASGCTLETREPCVPGGVDIGNVYALSLDALNTVASASASGWLLAYLLLVGLLAQITIDGLRGRVVRTFAAIMCAGLMPFVLAVTSAAFAPFQRCAAMIDTLDACEELGLLTGIDFYGNALFNWLANIAVPLAGLITILVAFTMGYRLLIGRLVRFCLPSRD